MSWRHADRELLKLLQEDFVSLPMGLLVELAAGAIIMTSGTFKNMTYCALSCHHVCISVFLTFLCTSFKVLICFLGL